MYILESLSLSHFTLNSDWLGRRGVLFVFRDYLPRTHTSVPTLLSLSLSPCSSSPEIVIWDKLRGNTTIIDVTSQPCNQSQIISRMHRSKQWRPTNRIYFWKIRALTSLSLSLDKAGPPTLESDSEFGLSSTVLRQRRERRESETDSRRLLWYCVVQQSVHRCSPLCTQHWSPSPSSSSPPV